MTPVRSLGVSFMTRNIVNKPHLTPNPDQAHTPGSPDRGGDPPGARRPPPDACTPPGHGAAPGSEPADEVSTYDSSDDLDLILSQSIQEPEPDPNLDSSSAGSTRLSRDEAAAHLQKDRDKPPRTSEIFRSVIAPAASTPPSAAGPNSSAQAASNPQVAPQPQPEASPAHEQMISNVVVDRGRYIQDVASEEEDRIAEPRASWSLVLLLSYSSAITLAMIWMLWTGRWSKGTAPPPAASDQAQTTPESSSRATESAPVPPTPRIPPENLATLGKTIRLGDLEITPLSVIAAPVELRRSIQPGKRRREETALILRMRLTNVSKDYSFTPIDENLVRECGLRPHDPYIETSEGTFIRLFPLALDSEWSIVGQEFSTLRPGATEETFVAAEPGSARNLVDEMTWRVRLRIGVYRTDMLGVRFTKGEVRYPRTFGPVEKWRSPR